MLSRGASVDEVVRAIQKGTWEIARKGRLRSKHTFPFGQVSPVNLALYKFKTVEAVFVKERTQIVVITVKVYYSNEKEAST